MTAIPLQLSEEAVRRNSRDDLAHAHGHEHRISFVKKYIFSTDHKVIGLQFLFIGLFFMVIGGLLAMAVRWQLAWPNGNVPGGTKFVPILSSWVFPGGTADKPVPMPS